MRPIIVFIGIVLMLLSVLAGSVEANQIVYTKPTCAISTGHGLLLDLDCDRVSDAVDNCPVFNPKQADSNNDGFGDVCAEMYGLPVYEKNTKSVLKRVQPKLTGLSKTSMKVMKVQDVIMNGPGAVFPIKITNSGDGQEFSFATENVDFGTFRFDPSNNVFLEAGETTTVYLHVMSEIEEEGQEYFNLVVSSQGETKRVGMIANVLQRKQSGEFGFVLEAVGWVLVLIVLIILAYIISKEFKNGRRRTELGEEFSYY